MLRTLFWTLIFFLGASMVAIQPACHNLNDRPMRRLLSSAFAPSTLKLVWPRAEL